MIDRCSPRAMVVVLGLSMTFGVACTDESSSPIDLDATTTTVPTPTLPDDDPNAQARDQVLEFAKEQCRLHPEREFGVVVIADADGNEVNRYEYPCADLDEPGQE